MEDPDTTTFQQLQSSLDPSGSNRGYQRPGEDPEGLHQEN